MFSKNCERTIIVATVVQCGFQMQEGPEHLVWNVAVKEALCIFRIPAHRKESIVKESPWRSMKTVFERTV